MSSSEIVYNHLFYLLICISVLYFFSNNLGDSFLLGIVGLGVRHVSPYSPFRDYWSVCINSKHGLLLGKPFILHAVLNHQDYARKFTSGVQNFHTLHEVMFGRKF